MLSWRTWAAIRMLPLDRRASKAQTDNNHPGVPRGPRPEVGAPPGPRDAAAPAGNRGEREGDQSDHLNGNAGPAHLLRIPLTDDVVAATLPSCADCGAAYDVNRHLMHTATCPLGRDLDAMSDNDRDWFAEHPGATFRRRPVQWCERDYLAMNLPVELPPGATWHGEVLVTQLAPGVRWRSYGDVFVILTPAGGAR